MIRCRKCGRLCADCLVRACKHPTVKAVFGEHICMYCCLKCKFHIRLTINEHGLCGVKCGYKGERSL